MSKKKFSTKKAIKIGDVVKLKSGGKKMTVVKVHNENIICWYFFGDTIRANPLPPECLKKVSSFWSFFRLSSGR